MLNTVPAIFFDRDGTINIDYGYIYKIDDFKFIDGSIEALKKLKKMGFLLVLVTNQSGIARGIFTECEFLRLTKWMSYHIAKYDLNIDGIYYCPHLPEAKIKVFRKHCNCRKPLPGMLFSAQKHLNIDMAASYMIGDTLEDMKVAQLAKVGTKVLVRTGKPLTVEVKNLANLVINSIVDLPTYLKN